MEDAYLLRHMMRADVDGSAGFALLVYAVGLSGMAKDGDSVDGLLGFKGTLSVVLSLPATILARGFFFLVIVLNRTRT